MPRKDPITGCNVMTFPEFIQGEAAREGKEPHEVMDEIFGAIEDDNERMREDYRKNALKYLQEEAKELLYAWDEDSKNNGEVHEYNRMDFKTGEYIKETSVYDAGPRPPQPIKLVEVVKVDFTQNFRSSKSIIVAKCEADDSKTYQYTLSRGDYSGSFYEPPDSDIDLQWEEVHA